MSPVERPCGEAFRHFRRISSGAVLRVEMQISQSTNYLVNSEGTVLRTPEDLAYIRVQARSLAPDGTRFAMPR